MVEEHIIMLGGDTPTTIWFIKNEKGLIVWSTFERDTAIKKIKLVGKKEIDNIES